MFYAPNSTEVQMVSRYTGLCEFKKQSFSILVIYAFILPVCTPGCHSVFLWGHT